VVGALVPGSTIILALSALVPGGELKLWGVLAAAIAGAVIGDGSAFWTGHRSQREILGAWPMSGYPGVMAQSEAFFHRWGTLAVFFARFVPPIRAFVPVTAGALGMRPVLFFGINMPACRIITALSSIFGYWPYSRRQSSRSASGRGAAAGSQRLPRIRLVPDARAPDRHSGRGAGSTGHAAIARRHARSTPPCGTWKTAPVHGRAAGRACAPAPQAHSRY